MAGLLLIQVSSDLVMFILRSNLRVITDLLFVVLIAYLIKKTFKLRGALKSLRITLFTNDTSHQDFHHSKNITDTILIFKNNMHMYIRHN
jgi:hypothetical protein